MSCTRWLGAVVLAATLTVSRPLAAAEPEPQRVRTGLELLGFLGLDLALLTLTPPPEADPPGNVRLVDKLTLKAWSYDASQFSTNFGAHPLAGTFYYTTARSNRSSPLESLGWASVASLTWELAEYPENVSFNDLIVTPIAGASIGEPLVQLSRQLDRRGHPFLAALLFPMKVANGLPRDEDEVGDLDADLRLVTRVGGSPQLGVQFASRVVRLPESRFALGSDVTDLSLAARGGNSGLADFHFHTGTSLATFHDGGLLATAGVAYDLRQHDWGNASSDVWSSVRIPGVSLQYSKITGDFRAVARAEVAVTFAGARSFASDGGVTAPVATLTTTQQSWGYTMGFGYAAAPSLQIAYGPVSLGIAASLETRSAANGKDPWPNRHPSASVSDRWAGVRGAATAALPWDLTLSASLERNVRTGSIDGARRTAAENVALIGLGFSIR